MTDVPREPQTRYRPYRYEQAPVGKFGELVYIGDKVQCHVCGRLYRSVAVHAVQAHGLPADEYRELFELGYTTALEGKATKARRAEHGARMVAKYGSHLPSDSRGSSTAGRTLRLEMMARLPDRNAKISRVKRQDVCARGHSMVDAYVRPSDGKRRCRPCRTATEAARYRRHHARETVIASTPAPRPERRRSPTLVGRVRS